VHLARNSETCFVHVHDGTRITQRNRNFVMFRETPKSARNPQIPDMPTGPVSSRYFIIPVVWEA